MLISKRILITFALKMKLASILLSSLVRYIEWLSNKNLPAWFRSSLKIKMSVENNRKNAKIFFPSQKLQKNIYIFKILLFVLLTRTFKLSYHRSLLYHARFTKKSISCLSIMQFSIIQRIGGNTIIHTVKGYVALRIYITAHWWTIKGLSCIICVPNYNYRCYAGPT